MELPSKLTHHLQLLKRISQLSGYLFPDPVLPSLNTVSDAINYLDRASKPKPKKLAGLLDQRQDLAELPNVRIAKKQLRQVDREREVGRLKVIEKELERLGLPALTKERERKRA